MGENSHIEWCDHTFNPWEGCTKVSPGCAHCYAEARDRRFTGGKHWGKGAPRRRTSPANWKLPLKWNTAARLDLEDAERESCGHLHTRPRVFCASLADWLDDEVPVEWLADLLELIHKTPNLDWLLLTKRPGNFHRRLFEVEEWHIASGQAMKGLWLCGWRHGMAGVPQNVWIGTTTEDQQRADERIPELLKIPASERFLSCEPLLGPVSLRDPHTEFGDGSLADLTDAPEGWDFYEGIHWVIAGGESGDKARPMHPDWARDLRDQCQAAGVPFLFKQHGEHVHEVPGAHRGQPAFYLNAEGQRATEAEALAAGGLWQGIFRVGKKAAGRELDGRTWDEFPRVEALASK